MGMGMGMEWETTSMEMEMTCIPVGIYSHSVFAAFNLLSYSYWMYVMYMLKVKAVIFYSMKIKK